MPKCFVKMFLLQQTAPICKKQAFFIPAA